MVCVLAGGAAGQRLDAPHAGADRAFGHHRDEPDVAGAPHMGAAAQLDRPAERVARPRRPWRRPAPRRRISRRTARARPTRWRRRRAISRVVTGAFCSTISFAMSSTRSISSVAHRLGVGEVEAQPVGRDQRALLRDVVAQHLAQRLVQQVGRGMVAADVAAAAHDRLQGRARSPGLSVPSSTTPEWTNRSPAFFWVSVTRKRTPVRRHHAGVADLAAGFAVERRLVEHHRAGLALGRAPRPRLPSRTSAATTPSRALGLVAQKLGRAELLAQREPHGFGRGLAGARPRGARLFALALHRGVEGRKVDPDAARLAARPG